MGGLGRIYFRAVNDYADRFGIAGSAFDDFLMFIHELDSEYVEHVNEKQKAEAEKNKTKS